MSTESTFRADRRDPTDVRSWRQTPVFAGDVAVHVDDPSWWMVVTGVLPRAYVEVVNVDRVEQAPGEFRDVGDVEEALRDGRIVPKAIPRREVAPLLGGIADHYA